MKKYILTIIILVVVAVGGYYVLEANKTETSSTSDTLFIQYSQGGEFSEYSDGDVYGKRIDVAFNGNVDVYDRIYHVNNGERNIEDVKQSENKIDQNKISELKSLLEESSFFEYQESLPDIDPRKVQINTPAKSIEISTRKSSDTDLKTVNANLGASQEHYPDGFFEIINNLESIINSTQ